MRLYSDMDSAERQFQDLVNRYSERLYWHLRTMVGSHDDADDLLQDVFIKAWKALPGFRGDADIFTWLWRIATNEALGFLRRAKVRSILTFRSLDGEALSVPDTDAPLDAEQAAARLQKAIASLPPKQRAVFHMRYYEEMAYEQISRITGTSVGALKASYHFAYEKIKQYVLEEN
ncbi:MAG: RNA polymerase sigma factor [Bacteroidales bacterium]|nr:RNA polymerase sigma factor [Bacteroidales bacterium]